MGHFAERTEKNCLNCYSIVQGRFCQNCGQENIMMKHSFWQMTQHFVSDIFHFDGKFFTTIKQLLAKPGKVAKEYASGRRNSYLDPIRMYLFISAVTFILFPLVTNINETLSNVHIIANPNDRLKEASKKFALLRQDQNNSEASKSLQVLLDTTVYLLLKGNADSTSSGAIEIKIEGESFKAEPLKDSILFPERYFLEKLSSRGLKKKIKKEDDNVNKVLLNTNTRSLKMLPYQIFFLLPIFSFTLKLLYKKNGGFHFSDHAVFTLYHFILSFALLIFFLVTVPLFRLLNIDNFQIIYLPYAIVILTYLLLELRRFYNESWKKTFVKFLVITIGSSITLFIFYTLFSVLVFIF